MYVRVLALLVAFALLTACSGDPRPRPSAPASVPVSKRPWLTPEGRACRGGVPFSTVSPPYAGRGPHKVIGFSLVKANEPGLSMAAYEPGLPASWTAVTDAVVSGLFPVVPRRKDLQRAQLALCVLWQRATGGPATEECAYERDGTRDVVPTRYGFKVFEARTGRLVKAFTLDGTDDICPGQVGLTDGRDIAAGVRDEDLANALRPLVTGRVPSG